MDMNIPMSVLKMEEEILTTYFHFVRTRYEEIFCCSRATSILGGTLNEFCVLDSPTDQQEGQH